MQTLRAHVRKMYLWSFFFFVFMFIALVVYSTAFNVLDNTDCQSYNHTKELNGGTKNFDNEKFIINICGAGLNNSLFNGDGMERVRLTIFDDQGELLARRYYRIFWDGQPGHEPLKEALIYSIFRPFNALEALIYQGATAGF